MNLFNQIIFHKSVDNFEIHAQFWFGMEFPLNLKPFKNGP